MICYSCGFKLHNSDEKECRLCGAKFGASCPACQFPNPSMARYCFFCGHPLAANAGSTVQNYAPLKESRKDVAVIFADVSGFTSLSERMDPEELREIINDCFTYITRPVYEMGGTIDKYIGDCIMILFGAQKSHADDARRAVLCAMQIMNLLDEFSELRTKPLGFSLGMSIGIHYGLVVTGSIGNFFDRDYTVMGDTVNTAQRIQFHTPRGTILVSEAVYRETHSDIQYSAPLEINVKNKKDVICCYTAEKILKSDSKSRDTIPMVGREQELYRLLDKLYKAMTHASQSVTLIGQAGVGKTRLAEEFISKIDERIRVIKVECSPSFLSRPYSLLESLMLKLMNISEGDSMEVKRSRVISYIDYILGSIREEDKRKNYQFIGLAMGIVTDDAIQNILASMNINDIADEIQTQFSLFFQSYSLKYKAVFLLEDIHWADSRSWTAAHRIIEQCEQPNLFLLSTSRNNREDQPCSLGERMYDMILPPLDREQTVQMMTGSLGCDEVSPTLIERINGFCGGIPLYIREFIQYLKKNDLCIVDHGMAMLIGDGEVKLPDSLQRLILSKFNDMEDGTAEILRTASIVGKDFHLSLINHLLGRNIEATGELNTLLQSNILSLKAAYPVDGQLEKVYTFIQESEREVIYHSLLLKQRKEFHRRIAEAMEFLYKNFLENYYEGLAEHFDRAGVPDKAAEYLYHTAEKQKSLYNLSESLGYFSKALDRMTKSGDRMRNGRMLAIYREMNEVHTVTGQYDKAMECIDSALKLTRNSEEKSLLLLFKARIYKEQGSYQEAMEILKQMQPRLRQSSSAYGPFLLLRCSIQRILGYQEEALRIAQKAERVLARNKDYENLAKTLNAAGAIYFSMGTTEKALNCFEKSYHYAQQVNDLQTMQKSSSNLGVIYHQQGRGGQAAEFLEEAMELSKRLSHRQGYISNSINLGIIHLHRGSFIKAKVLFQEALEAAEAISSRLFESTSLTNLGDVMFHYRDYSRAKEYFSKALQVSDQIEDIEGRGINQLGLARVSIALGEMECSKLYLDKAFAICRQLEDNRGLAEYYYHIGWWDMKQEQIEDGLSHAELSIRYAMECQDNHQWGRALRLKARLLQRKEAWADSMPLLQEAIAIADQEDSPYNLAKGFYLRSISCQAIGLIKEAQKDMTKAREWIRQVDDCHWTEIILHGTA